MQVIFNHRFPMRKLFLVSLLSITLGIGGFLPPAFPQEVEDEESDPAEITNGERLFLETRFAQFFKKFLDNGRDVNDPLSPGDPVLEKAVNWQINDGEFAEHPFTGLSMNCRNCHFVDELGVEDDLPGYNMRTYSDFARRSPMPAREDGKTVTVRNSPPLVNTSLPRKNFFQHFDAEFKTLGDLVESTLTGRNYGWVPGEKDEAVKHIARVIREDDGSGELAQDFEGLSYPVLLKGTDPSIPEDFILPQEFRVDVPTASDLEIFQAVAGLIAAYTEDLAFSQDDDGNFNLSPYDVFLEINNLSRQPQRWESPIRYSTRLLRTIRDRETNGSLRLVTENPNTDNGQFEFHDRPFVFGETELKGLQIFFSQRSRSVQPSDLERGNVGNCIACHAAPNFTDFSLHNTGIAQAEYDGIHGAGSFARLDIPNLRERRQNPNEYLPGTEEHPDAKEPFRAVPSAENLQLTDLGTWNIFRNPDFPRPQSTIFWGVCIEELKSNFRIRNIFQLLRICRPSRLLPKTVALFKTPGLRDLGHSAPYSHTGQADTLEDVIRGYINNSNLSRNNGLRNGDRRMKQIVLTEQDIAPLAAFLRSLNEDYN